MKLKNAQVVVTGATGGIGHMLVQALRMAGATVVGVGRVGEGQGELLQADLSSAEGIRAFGARLAEMKPDILVNLAGVQYFGLLEHQPPEQVVQMYMINLLAPVLLSQAVLPLMKERKRGQIVNIGSVFGSIPFAHFITYSSTKAGLKGFSQALRRELADSGITVTHISPRAVKTPLNTERIRIFAQKTRMNVDAPEEVVRRIVAAIEADAKEVVIGRPESFFTHVHALMPGLVDQALAKNDRIARDIVSQPC